MGGHGPPHTALPQSFLPAVAPSGALPAASAVVAAGMFETTQCTHVRVGAAGSGASGSSTISAKLFAEAGAPDHASGGETSAPSQAGPAGIAGVPASAGDVTVRRGAPAPGSGASAPLPPAAVSS